MEHTLTRRQTLKLLASSAALTGLGSLGLYGCGGNGNGFGGSGGGKPVDVDRRLAIFEVVNAKLDSMSRDDLEAMNREIAAFMATLPEFEATGVTEDLCAWGRFTDGRLYVVINNREPEGAPAAPLLAPGRATGTTMPQPTTVRLLFSPEGGLTTPAELFRPTLSAHGYQIVGGAVQKGGIEDYRAVRGDGIVYIDAHGFSGMTRQRGMIFGVETATKVTKTTELLYAGDLSADRLVYTTLLRTRTSDGTVLEPSYGTFYGISPRFVADYMRFGPNSVVFVNACSSDNAEFKAACLRAGAGAYLGWTKPVGDQTASESAAFMFDRLLGENGVVPKDDPARPPLDIAELRAAMATTANPRTGKPYDTFEETGRPTAKLIFSSGTGDLRVIVPSIASVTVDEEKKQWILRGIFGDVPGTADVNGTLANSGKPLEIVSWSADRIVTNIEEDAKSVIVRVAGRSSNVAPLPIAGDYQIEPFTVDDNMTLWLNGEEVYRDTDGAFAGTRGPFVLTAKPGDTVRLQVRDFYGRFAGVSDVTIVRPNGTKRLWIPAKQFTTEPGNKSVVVDETTTLD